MSEVDVISRFWSWWELREGQFARELRDGSRRPSVLQDIDQHVREMGLESMVVPLQLPGPGFLLVASAGSEVRRRRLAAEWRAAAPTSELFVFDTHRAPLAFARFADTDLQLGTPATARDLRFRTVWDERVARAKIFVSGLPAEAPYDARFEAAAYVVMAALGELIFDCWADGIELEEGPAATPLPLEAFVDDFAAGARARARSHFRADGYETADGGQILMTLLSPLHPAKHPLLDTAVRWTTKTGGSDMSRAQDRQDELIGRLPESEVLHVATLSTTSERDAIFYVDPESPSARTLRERAERLGEALTWEYDPTWGRALALQRPSDAFQLRFSSDRATAAVPVTPTP